MVVESAPGKFADMYSFSSERKLVESNLGLSKVMCPRNPTVDKLKELVTSGQPDIVHLAGIDSHQGEQLLHRQRRTTWDGYLMADVNGNPAYATAEQLAEALRRKKVMPRCWCRATSGIRPRALPADCRRKRDCSYRLSRRSGRPGRGDFLLQVLLQLSGDGLGPAPRLSSGGARHALRRRDRRAVEFALAASALNAEAAAVR